MWTYEIIRELAQVVASENRVRSFQTVFLAATGEHSGQAFLYGILTGTIHSDVQAREFLKARSSRRETFRAFKSRFIEETLNCYLTLDTTCDPHGWNCNEYRLTTFRECARIAMDSGCQLLALRILNDGSRAATLQENACELFLYSRLIAEISLREASETSADTGKVLTSAFLQRWMAESQLEDRSQSLDIDLYSTSPVRQEYIDDEMSILRCFDQTTIAALSFNARQHRFNILIALGALSGDVDQIEQAVLQASSEFANDDHQFRLSGIVTRQAHAYLLLRNHRRTLQLLGQNKPPTMRHQIEWQLFHESLIVALIHDGSYAAAMDAWNEASQIHRPRIDSTSQRDHGWHLLGGYLALLEQLGVTNGAKRILPFRLRSFLNSLPRPLHSDLRIGLPYLTLEIALAIASFDYDVAQRRIEYAHVSSIRLAGHGSYRRYLVFLKILRSILYCRFVPSKIAVKTERHRDELQRISDETMPTHLAEIIPFERLYDLLMDVMQQNVMQSDD